ncbi:MAG TPA: dihydrolipoamide acetyltransferase family protein [Thermoanaerobaculia bacterium]|nr:dihydrolipoamide acetyltransferase family protein [Thermoanaerobaculia bacterium]
MLEFRMPSLGADMEAGTLTRWLVKPGDRVERGDIVAVVETEKSDIDVEIWEGGVIENLLVGPGERVPVGTLLATLRPLTPAAAPPPAPPPQASPAPAPQAAEPAAPKTPPQPAPPTAPPSTAAPPARATPAGPTPASSPAARARAAELGVDLTTLSGSGPGGAVLLSDVERAAAGAPTAAPSAPPPALLSPALPEPSPRDRAASMRRAIGAAMARSKREIPHYYLAAEVDLSRALGWLTAENARRPIEQRLLPAVLLLKATSLAVAKVPELNGFWENDAFRPGAGVHLGVAISIRGGGLIAPALHDADTKSLSELMAGLTDLVQRARAGSLRSSEMSDPTITVTNLGDQGVEAVYGVIYPPQVALVGFGRIRERPWAEDGRVSARPTVTATLAADHRASDGHRGAIFLTTLAAVLQEPEKL